MRSRGFFHKENLGRIKRILFQPLGVYTPRELNGPEFKYSLEIKSILSFSDALAIKAIICSVFMIMHNIIDYSVTH